MENEQADAGRDCRTRPARLNYPARTGTGEIDFPFSADREQDWQPYPVDPYSAICDDHTYIHIYGDIVTQQLRVAENRVSVVTATTWILKEEGDSENAGAASLTSVYKWLCTYV